MLMSPGFSVFTGAADKRVMELKVWVDGVVRVVCGLTLSTSCKDVVIALAQSLGNYLRICFGRGGPVSSTTCPSKLNPSLCSQVRLDGTFWS